MNNELFTRPVDQFNIQDCVTHLKDLYDSEFFHRDREIIAHFTNCVNSVLFLYPSQDKLLSAINFTQTPPGYSHRKGLKPEILDIYLDGVDQGIIEKLRIGCDNAKKILDSFHPQIRLCGQNGYIRRDTPPGLCPELTSVFTRDTEIEIMWGPNNTSTVPYTRRVRDLNWTQSSGRPGVVSYRFPKDVFDNFDWRK
jgi:hypothetical protein